jgi:hypothetical protein
LGVEEARMRYAGLWVVAAAFLAAPAVESSSALPAAEGLSLDTIFDQGRTLDRELAPAAGFTPLYGHVTESITSRINAQVGILQGAPGGGRWNIPTASRNCLTTAPACGRPTAVNCRPTVGRCGIRPTQNNCPPPAVTTAVTCGCNPRVTQNCPPPPATTAPGCPRPGPQPPPPPATTAPNCGQPRSTAPAPGPGGLTTAPGCR